MEVVSNWVMLVVKYTDYLPLEVSVFNVRVNDPVLPIGRCVDNLNGLTLCLSALPPNLNPFTLIPTPPSIPTPEKGRCKQMMLKDEVKAPILHWN